MSAVRARAPASSANLGPGFDTLAVAVDRYVSVEVEPADSLRVHTEGEGAGLFDDASHLAARVVAEVLGHDRFSVTVRSQIPVARGPGLLGRPGRRRRRRRRGRRPLRRGGGVRRAPRERRGQRLRRARGGHLGGRRARPRRLAARRRARSSSPSSPTGTWPRPRPAGCCRTGSAARTPSSTSGAWACSSPAWPIPAALRARGHRGPDPPTGTHRRCSPRRRALLAALVEAGALAACWSGAGPTLIGFVAARIGGGGPCRRRRRAGRGGNRGAGALAAGGPARPRLRRRGRGGRSRVRPNRPTARSSFCTALRSCAMAPFRLNVLRTWL